MIAIVNVERCLLLKPTGSNEKRKRDDRPLCTFYSHCYGLDPTTSYSCDNIQCYNMRDDDSIEAQQRTARQANADALSLQQRERSNEKLDGSAGIKEK